MRINWKLRLKNKTVLVSLIVMIVTVVYSVLSDFGITPSVPADNVIKNLKYVVYILSLLGIVVDPTTKGISDSDRALEYADPSDDNLDKSVVGDPTDDENEEVTVEEPAEDKRYIPSDEDAVNAVGSEKKNG